MILEILLVLVLLIVNGAISTMNAYTVGKSWNNRKNLSLWQKALLWSGFIMSGCGFSWCFLFILGFLATVIGYIDSNSLMMMLNLGYLIILPLILVTGAIIWIQSIVNAWHQRSIGSVIIAGWNSFAMISNIIEAFLTVPDTIESLGGFFKTKGDAKTKVIILAIIAIILGFITTYAIVKVSAKYSQYSRN